MGRGRRRVRARSERILLPVAILVCALALAGLGVASAITRSALDDIETAAAAEINGANATIASFRGDPGSADDAAEALEAHAAQLRSHADEAAAIRPLPGPPGEAARRYRDELVAFLAGAAEYDERLATIAGRIITRADAMERLAEGLGVLDELAAPDLPAEEVTRVLGEVSSVASGTASEIRAMDAQTTLDAYSSDSLLERLDAIARYAGGMEAAIAAKDAVAFREASAAFGALLQADWRALFFEADAAGIAEVEATLTGLVERRSAVEDARATLGSLVAAAVFGGIASLAIAVLVYVSRAGS